MMDTRLSNVLYSYGCDSGCGCGCGDYVLLMVVAVKLLDCRDDFSFSPELLCNGLSGWKK